MTGAHAANTPADIEADIERQREELAATVDALHARLDVKSRAKQRAAELRDRATTDSGKPRPVVIGAVVGVVAVAGGLLWLKVRGRD